MSILFIEANNRVSDQKKVDPRRQIIEPVFLVSEFSLRYLLIFEDQILGLDFGSRCQKKKCQMRFWDDMILRPEEKAHRC